PPTLSLPTRGRERCGEPLASISTTRFFVGSGSASKPTERVEMARAWDDPRIARGMTEQLAARRARIAAGEAPLGWKVGFGAPAMMGKFKTTAPLVGYLMKGGLIASGGSASLKGWVKPVAEPEIAVHIGHDLKGGGDRAAAAAAISALSPAIEL